MPINGKALRSVTLQISLLIASTALNSYEKGLNAGSGKRATQSR